jgi:hypothetical protein
MHEGEPSAAPNSGTCDLCGAAVPRRSQVFSLVRDYFSIHPYDPDEDGERLLTVRCRRGCRIFPPKRADGLLLRPVVGARSPAPLLRPRMSWEGVPVL